MTGVFTQMKTYFRKPVISNPALPASEPERLFFNAYGFYGLKMSVQGLISAFQESNEDDSCQNA